MKWIFVIIAALFLLKILGLLPFVTGLWDQLFTWVGHQSGTTK